MRALLLPLALAGLACPPSGALRAAGDCAADAMLVFDGSASMSEIGLDFAGATRIEEARVALARAMPDIAPYRRVGLVVYGPGDGGSCSGIDLRFTPRPDAAAAVIGAIQGLSPAGLTPLAAAVQLAAEALDHKGKPGVVVLVTDGNETCGGRPCALGAALAATSSDLTVHVVGFRAVVDYWTWDNPEQRAGEESVASCLADRTGGLFLKTQTIDELTAALQRTLGCPVIGDSGPDRAAATGHRRS